MAMFERRHVRQTQLDDTIPLTCVVEQAQLVKDHTEYLIKVQRGILSENHWSISKRYNDFVALDSTLKITNIPLPLPPKKVFGNMDREFILERQKGLQVFLNELMKYYWLANSLVVKQFLDPSNYMQLDNTPEKAFQHISLLYRSDLRWEIQEPVPQIGWRLRTQYVMVKDKDKSKEKYILSWSPLGPYATLEEKDLGNFLKLLTTLQHPYIETLQAAIMSEDVCGCSIRKFYEQGSLRDIICKTKPKSPFLKKYPHSKTAGVLSVDLIQLYGRQILEALKFLHEKNIPYGHLHAGNVVVEDNNRNCRLLSVDNWFIGLPSLHRPNFLQFRKIQTLEQIDVYCFGHLVYEMAFGEILNAPNCDFLPVNCHPEVRSVLESILSSAALKEGLPTVSDLLTHKLFGSIRLPFFEKPQFRIPSKLKDILISAKTQFEQALHSDQNVIYQQKRINKAADFHMSDEEKRRRRRSKLKQQHQSQEVLSASMDNNLTEHSSEMFSPPGAPPVTSTPKPTSSGHAPGSPDYSMNSNDSTTNTPRKELLTSIESFSKHKLKRSNTMTHVIG